MKLEEKILQILSANGLNFNVQFSTPPNPQMGDLSFACFELAKAQGKNPVECAKELAVLLNLCGENKIVEKVVALGPYVNFYFDAKVLAKEVLFFASKKDFGENKFGKGKKAMVEFAHPNTHKAFHIGHLRNITTGESLSRILANAGYKVSRVNYQGDVGLHIAKCMWGILRSEKEYLETKKKSIDDRAEFLGKVYAVGGQAYEKDEQAKKEIVLLNEQIYNQSDKKINVIYKDTRKWSLDYFAKIYKRVGVNFDRLYFESQVFKRGRELVLEGVKNEILKQSQGAVIFEGEKYGLHNRVFLNSQGLPTYEAKDLALAELQMKEYKPDIIFHVVAKEQIEYFRVLFKALEYILPKSQNKEKHLVYGWVTLKEGKMSSRTGQVVLGEWLLDEVKDKIKEIVRDHDIKNKEIVAEKVAVAAVKYTFLHTSTSNDIVFSINESVSLTGDSGPYLLYIVARIKSILKKTIRIKNYKVKEYIPELIEKNLLNKLSEFDEIAKIAAIEFDPSQIAHYLLDLAQNFNNFYAHCPVLKTEGEILFFRLNLIKVVEKVMTKGLYLLGIDTVEEM